MLDNQTQIEILQFLNEAYNKGDTSGHIQKYFDNMVHRLANRSKPLYRIMNNCQDEFEKQEMMEELSVYDYRDLLHLIRKNIDTDRKDMAKVLHHLEEANFRNFYYNLDMYLIEQTFFNFINNIDYFNYN